ncbi:hypothetical protein FUAX_40770 (plasmid) [Fulvitalea axinellae]|uniref:Uncharacterized protein n=1 Tax=Fulvitalea axinellae TaxID=1182444 RepID=A0AAU9CQI1_9BACT|nr:hypothetical protein FUAX_40770 [Fulvitalea axinellae]
MDYLMDKDMDLAVEDGDFLRGEAGDRNELAHLVTAPGDWKQYPELGADLARQLNDEAGGNLYRAVADSMGRDGYRVKGARISDGKLRVDAEDQDA